MNATEYVLQATIGATRGGIAILLAELGWA